MVTKKGEKYTAAPAGARGFAVAQIAIDLAIAAVNWYIQNRIEKDQVLINEHANALKKAASDVNYAVQKRDNT